MQRSLLIGAVALLAAGNAFAAPLTPAQALQRLESENGSRYKAAVKSADRYSLATLGQLSEQTGGRLYVFTDDAEGYIVTSADSDAPALLGYGSGFDAENIPDAMRWWLGEYARQIAWLAENPRDQRPEMAAHAAISPLVATKWNQSDLYNRKCPSDNGGRCVTGCVATAMAQVVNYHKWPQTTGTGTYSYTWNNKTLSFDYGATTFDWAHMNNTYSGSSSTTACNAVATLMSGCGVCVDMNYSSSASGAMSYKIASALVRNFGYDQGSVYVMRDYYSASDWDMIIYGELAAGRPVLYGGQSSAGGHEFVCDGYDGNGKYHINWGWGGMSDGYFLLSALDPYQQGIGGSTSGFNYDQDACIGVQPPVAGSERSLPLYANGGFAYSPEYSGFWFGTNSEGGVNGFFNYSVFTFDAVIGVRLEGEGGYQAYAEDGAENFEPIHGFALISPTFPADLPAGTYKAYPAARYADSEVWHDILTPYGESRYVTVRKGNNGVITYDGSDPDAVEVPVRVSELSQRGDWIPGESMVVDVTYSNTSASAQTFKLDLRFDGMEARSSYKIGTWTLDIDANAPRSHGLNCGTCELPVGVYSLTAIDVQKGAVISDPVEVYVGVRPTAVDIVPEETSVKVGATATLAATVTPANAFDTTVVWASSDPAVATVDADGKVTGVSAGTATVTATTVNGMMNEARVTVTDTTQAVETFGVDDNAMVDVYNLQGIRIRASVTRAEATAGLPAGVYVIDGRKVTVR